MTDEENLAVLRSLKLGHDKEWMTKPLKEALEWAIQCCDAAQYRAKTLRYDEITAPGIYLAKTEVGDEVIPLTIRADQINLGTVFMGFTYQGPVEWVEE